MRELEKPIGQAWRRLRFQRFLSALVWCWGGTLLLAAVAVGVEKAGRPIPGQDWLPLAIAAGLGVVAAALIAAFTGPTRVDAAVAIDRAFQLHERLATALTLPAEARDTPAGRALLADTFRHLKDLDIGSKFGPRLPRLAWVPVLPALLAVGLLFAPTWTQRTARARVDAAIDKLAVSQQTKALVKKIASQRKDLDKGKFAEADKLLAEIEKAADDLSKAPPQAKDKALVELNKITDAIKERQKQLGTPEQVNRQLKQLKEMSSTGPADEFNKSLANGDFEKAANEAKKLADKLAKNDLSEADKKALKEQLGEMKQQLEKLANLDERKRQLDQAAKNGGLTKEQHQKEMAKLDEQAKNLKQLQKLAEKLADAQQKMTEGDMKKAAEALGMTQAQLKEMAKSLQELESLDSALAELQDAKAGMNGADPLNQLGENMSGTSLGNRMNMNGGNNQGQAGRGAGERAEAKDDTASYNTKVKLEHGKGKAVLEGFAPPSAQKKGQSIVEVSGDLETATGAAAEALTNQKVPRNVEKHVKGYFDRLNKNQ